MALGVLCGAVALSACSSSPSKSGSSTTSNTSASTSTSTTSASATTSTVPSTSSTTAGTATCQPSGLHVVLSGSGGAAGTIELTFSLTNATSTVCTLFGYPGMQLLNSTGGSLPTVVKRGGGLSFESLPVTTVSLNAGQTAFFNVGYNDVNVGTTSCSAATRVEVTPPNDTAFTVVTVPEVNACDGGVLNTSPVFSSSDATATSTTAPPVP